MDDGIYHLGHPLGLGHLFSRLLTTHQLNLSSFPVNCLNPRGLFLGISYLTMTEDFLCGNTSTQTPCLNPRQF